ncbi:hypothetical protein [Cellulomonas iranensis]|uniref:hypothetical protein n=1 Tax=Cellulomonas iranensis TaxID=76862 RepID=UPI0013CF9F5A|nr:hypothetical protein [Cellulomonas iranensis]
MSEQTRRALDDAIRAHVADEHKGPAVAVAWLVGVGTVGDPDSDFFWDGPTDQPGYVSAGLGVFLHGITAGTTGAEAD